MSTSRRRETRDRGSRPGLGPTRRTVVRMLGLGTGALYLEACTPLGRRDAGGRRAVTDAIAAFSPIDRSLGELAPRAFSGDVPELAHEALWDPQRFLAARRGKTDSVERLPLVVIGGGVAGLTAAYLLRDHHPVVLERAVRFGGNSRGESWRGSDYAIGAAYFIEPDPGTPIDGFLSEIGVDREWRVKVTEDPVIVASRRHDSFWDGESDPASREAIRRLGQRFVAILEGSGAPSYPDIPVVDDSTRPEVNALDRMSFLDWLREESAGNLHPHVAAALEHYCWSSLGASTGEVSAAAGLNFYCAEFGNICVLPGGNAAVAEGLLARLGSALPPGHLRPGALAVAVDVADQGVTVTYVDAAGGLRRVLAAAVVMACPKFVAATILRDIEAERRTAIESLRYRSYVVANVLLRRPINPDFYDLFLAGDGTVDLADVRHAAELQRVTDVVLGTWVRPSVSHAILTLYYPLPYDGARAELLDDAAYSTVRRTVEDQVVGEILPLVGSGEKDVVDLRLTRWGHPLPVAAPGLIAGGVVDALRRPFRDRVFFVEQDNWALPAFETAVIEALGMAPRIAAVLQRG